MINIQKKLSGLQQGGSELSVRLRTFTVGDDMSLSYRSVTSLTFTVCSISILILYLCVFAFVLMDLLFI